ncbi:hypothetical protein HPB50_011464 [Hyalomma asiaticum]|uniref:Uncharacterized protein n=1 Tax=Hyalomma asiaticum TaxID=266040 RepID=A0ACB7TJ70_HYAAI|nr:hypothetical protein HPB50_011464 [Hyalomma asiaticum]
MVTTGSQYSLADLAPTPPPNNHPSSTSFAQGAPAAPTFQVPEVTFSQASGTTHTNERASVPLEKPPSAPECPPEAMEVTPGPSASARLMGSPKVRRSSLDRLKGKKHPPVKPPDKGGEV